MKRHLKTMTEPEISEFGGYLKNFVAQWLTENNFSGGSQLGSHDLYEAMDNAITGEVEKARHPPDHRAT